MAKRLAIGTVIGVILDTATFVHGPLTYELFAESKESFSIESMATWISVSSDIDELLLGND